MYFNPTTVLEALRLPVFIAKLFLAFTGKWPWPTSDHPVRVSGYNSSVRIPSKRNRDCHYLTSTPSSRRVREDDPLPAPLVRRQNRRAPTVVFHGDRPPEWRLEITEYKTPGLQTLVPHPSQYRRPLEEGPNSYRQKSGTGVSQ